MGKYKKEIDEQKQTMKMTKGKGKIMKSVLRNRRMILKGDWKGRYNYNNG